MFARREAEEMLRKLLLSVIGAFWSTTSTMLIATALLISLAFQLLHTHYSPFRSKGLNRLQQLSLTVLSTSEVAPSAAAGNVSTPSALRVTAS